MASPSPRIIAGLTILPRKTAGKHFTPNRMAQGNFSLSHYFTTILYRAQRTNKNGGSITAASRIIPWVFTNFTNS
jgi:hypothetical protein